MTLDEIILDVEQQVLERIDSITANPTQHVYSKIRVIFENGDGELLGNVGEFDYFDAPNFILQETVFGDSLMELLIEKGKTCISREIIKGFGLPMDAKVAGVILSTEAIYATQVNTGKEKKVKGYPFLLVSGQTKNGFHKTSLMPLILDKNNKKTYSETVVLSSQMRLVIDKVEAAPPFLGKFFSDIGGGTNGTTKCGTIIFQDVPA